MSQPLELEIWNGDWGLPSIDITCLQVMVYCKMSGAPVVTKVKGNPFLHKMPTLRHGSKTCYNLQEVTSYLQKRNYNADHFLTPKDISEVQAYSQLLKDKLFPGLQFVWWVDNKNYVELTRPWYAKQLTFPLNYFYPGYYETQARDLISSLYGSLEEDYTTVETQVYSDAEKCLTLLSNKLGESKYFLGNQPSSLDAIIFSYLAPLLKAPFPNPILQNHLKACTNLVIYVETILEKYYSSVTQEYLRKKKALEKLEDSFPYKSRYQILAGLVALVAMSGYIILAPTVVRKDIYIENFYYEPEEESY